MKTYKVIKGTDKTLYIKGLKSSYFYIFCGVGIGGFLGIILLGLKYSFLPFTGAAFIYLILSYVFFFYLGLNKQFSNVKKKYTVIRNMDLIKIRKK